MKTIDRHTFPPGGWQFRQPQSGWSAPTPTSNTFDQQVVAIIKHRTKNPAMVAKNKLSTDFNEVANELEMFNRLRLGIPLESPPSFFPQSRASNVQDAAAGTSWFRKIVRTGTGIATLGDWLGKGGIPVDQSLANQRAEICSDCPQNKSGDFLSLFTKPASDLIRKQLQERKQLSYSTPADDRLHFCEACGCPLLLKVHVPIKEIRSHMKQPELNNLDPRCWIPKEQ
jgi:hypothetical protein